MLINLIIVDLFVKVLVVSVELIVAHMVFKVIVSNIIVFT